MEGKNTVILSVLVMSLVMAQIQVEGEISCCPSYAKRTKFNICLSYLNKELCAGQWGCKLVEGTCPEGYKYDILENLGDVFNEYCKLGCTSSVCEGINILQKSDASEIVNGAVEKCAKACSSFCTKGSTTRAGTA